MNAPATEAIMGSLPPEKAERILEKVHREMAPPPFSFLHDIDIHQASAIVREESPPAVALVLAHLEPRVAARIFGFLAVTLAAVNIFGGFMVTRRMLAMFKKKGS